MAIDVVAEGDVPPGGWVCFHCGEAFHTHQTAEDHFGTDQGEVAACVAILTEGERAIVEDRRYWRNRALEVEDENEKLGCQLNSDKWQLSRFGKDVRTINDAWHRYESLEGRLLSAEEKIKWLLTRLRDHGVPWAKLPHDDRTPREIVGPDFEWPEEHAEVNTPLEVIRTMCDLHARMLASAPSIRNQERRWRPVQVGWADSNAVMSALLLIETLRARDAEAEILPREKSGEVENDSGQSRSAEGRAQAPQGSGC